MVNNDLNSIFSSLKALLMRYQYPLVVKEEDATHYGLWSVKDLVIMGRNRKEIFFAGLIVQKHYVGFYFMPVYTDEDAKSFIKPELLRLLKGKSCFHIKKLDAELLAQIDTALKAGYQLYQQKGWI